MTLISRNDHLTAGAWAACGSIINTLSVVLVCGIAEYFSSSVLSLSLRPSPRQNTAQLVELGRGRKRQNFVYFAKQSECH